MNFNTANLTFRQLVGNGLGYRVPRFQRDYSWSEEDWDDLWQDITGLFEEGGESAHYLGYLVLQSSDFKQFDIIDGQQRITTISILILAALGHLQDLIAADLDAANNLKRKEQLQNSYIGYLDPITLVPRSKLTLNRHNNKFYQTYLVPLGKIPQRGLNSSEHQLRKAFCWFKESISRRAGFNNDSGTVLAVFIERMVDKLFFTVITVTDELNAFKVFETLNARGVRLSSTDLLKNHLFSVISTPETHETELQQLENSWERIVGLLGSESFPEYLRVFWNSRNKLVRKSELFNTIRRRISGREEAFELLRALDQCAETYAALRDPQDRIWNAEEKSAVDQLLMFKVRQPLSMLMACYERFFEEERTTFTRILRAVAVVSLRYNVICNLQTHEQERLYDDIAFKISQGIYCQLSEVIGALSPVYPTDEEFKAAFAAKILRTTNSRNKKIVRFILFETERQHSEKDFDFESSSYDLEHILPRNPSAEWRGIPEGKVDDLVYRIGNMTPLESSRNRDLGNCDYHVKRAEYGQSNFGITKAIAEHYNSWDERKIQSRQVLLAESASSIWRVDLLER